MLTDATFRIPAIRLIEARAAAGIGSPTFQYLFTWKTPAFGGVAGSCHALEIPFVFGALGNAGAELFLGGPAGPDLWALSEAMQDAWLAFARTGDPGHDGHPRAGRRGSPDGGPCCASTSSGRSSTTPTATSGPCGRVCCER